MGGLAQLMPYTTALMWIGGARARGHPAVRGLLLEGPDPRGRAARRRHRRLDRLVARAGRRVRDRALHVPHAARVFSRPAVDLRGRARAGPHRHGEGPFSMLWTIGVLAVGAIFVGLLEIPGVTHGMRNFLAPSDPARRRGDGRRRSSAPRCSPSRSRSRALRIAYVIWGRRSDAPRRRTHAATEPLPAVLEQKFGFDRLYDWPFYRPAAALAARRRAALGGRRRSLGSMTLVGAAGALDSSRLLARAVRPRPQLRPRVRARHRRARRRGSISRASA